MCAGLHVRPLHQNHIYTNQNHPTSSEQFLRASQEAVSLAMMLLLPPIKSNSQLPHCAFFSVDNVRRTHTESITNGVTTNKWKLLCLLFLLKDYSILKPQGLQQEEWDERIVYHYLPICCNKSHKQGSRLMWHIPGLSASANFGSLVYFI